MIDGSRAPLKLLMIDLDASNSELRWWESSLTSFVELAVRHVTYQQSCSYHEHDAFQNAQSLRHMWSQLIVPRCMSAAYICMTSHSMMHRVLTWKASLLAAAWLGKIKRHEPCGYMVQLYAWWCSTSDYADSCMHSCSVKRHATDKSVTV